MRSRRLLFWEWDVSGDAFLIFRKSIAELRSQQIVLNAHADLRADDKEQKGGQQQPPRCDERPGAEENAEHGGVNGMTNKAIRARGD